MITITISAIQDRFVLHYTGGKALMSSRSWTPTFSRLVLVAVFEAVQAGVPAGRVRAAA
jgi:hypothetical protein